jgi:predicted CoA-binding protein
MTAKKVIVPKPPAKKTAAKKTTAKAVKKAPIKKTKGDKPVDILKNAKTILLVDWPDKNVPLALLKAGFMVIAYSPDKYTLLSYETNYAKDKLVFSVLEGPPGQVEIVNIFRPEEEHEDIINHHALLLKAKTVWLHPPVISTKTAKLTRKYKLSFVEGYDIADVAAELSANK